MMAPVCYVAHPLSGDLAGNIAQARRWLRWLMASEPGVAWCMPWLPFAELALMDERGDDYSARCLRDDVAIAARCSGIVLCGGRISAGMEAERSACVANGGIVIDLTVMGANPPTDNGSGLMVARLLAREWSDG